MPKHDRSTESATNDPYTIVYHSVFKSQVANHLSIGAVGLLADWITVWMKATRNEKSHCGGVTFVWTGSQRNVSRGVFDKHRAELIEVGFIEVVNKQVGLYRASDQWENYEPDAAKASKLKRHNEARNRQRDKTQQYRKDSARKSGTTNGLYSAGNSSTTPDTDFDPSAKKPSTGPFIEAAEKLCNPQCPKTEQSLVPENRPHNNTNNTNHYPQGGGGEDSMSINTGLQKALESLRNTAKQKETDEDYCAEREQFEKSIEESTSVRKTPVQQFIHEFKAIPNLAELDDVKRRAAAAEVVGKHIGFSDTVSTKKIYKALKGVGRKAVETIVVNVIQAKNVNSRLGLLLHELKNN